VTCASPAYLARRGVPATLDDLPGHVAVNCMSSQAGRNVSLDFAVGGETVEVKLDGFVHVDEDHAYLSCGLQGLGLIQPPRIAALPYLRSGQLREVLGAWSPVATPVSVTYVKSRQASPRVRAFVDWLVELFDRTALDGEGQSSFGGARASVATAIAAASASLARAAENDADLEMEA
jgi:LysR family transcriptional regulator for bpeEF and oprC